MKVKPYSCELLFRCIQIGGFTAIGYEMLWVRRFSFFFGSTAQVFATILVAVLLGVALGAFGFSKWSRQRAISLSYYGYLELLVAGSALVSYFVSANLPFLTQHYLPNNQTLSTWIICFVGTFLLTGVTCTLIGASLPWLLVVIAGQSGEEANARAYSFYNLGSAFAAVVLGSMGFVFLGYKFICLILVGLNALVGLFFLITRKLVPPTAKPARAPSSTKVTMPLRALGIVSVVGFVTMFVETLHGQLLDYLLGGTRLGISATLASYFIGVSAGAAYSKKIGRDPIQILRLSFAMQTGALFLLGLCCFLPNPWPFFIESKLLASVILLLYVIFSFAGGLQFPMLVRWISDKGNLSRDPNREASVFAIVFYTETFAAIAGTLCFAFVTLRYMGTEGSVLFSLVLLAGASFSFGDFRKGSFKGNAFSIMNLGFVLVLACLFPSSLCKTVARSSIAMLGRGDHILMSQEDANGLLMVVRKQSGEVEIRNAYYVSGSTDIVRKNTQILQGLLAASLIDSHSRVLQIGYGNGQITRNLLEAHPQALDIVELHPQMVEVSARFFPGALETSQTSIHLYHQDGIAFVQKPDVQYDLVLSDSFIISSEMSTKLYTVEHFHNVQRLLSPNGILLTWLPTNIGNEGTLSILKNLTSVFSQVQLFYPTFGVGREMFAISYDRPRDLLKQQWEGLQRIKTQMEADPELPISVDYFWSRWLVSDDQLREFLSHYPNVRLHTEDRPILEYYVTCQIPGRRLESEPTLLETLFKSRDAVHLATQLGGDGSEDGSIKVDWIGKVREFYPLEHGTAQYLQDPSPQRLSEVVKAYPNTNIARLLREIENARTGRVLASPAR